MTDHHSLLTPFTRANNVRDLISCSGLCVLSRELNEPRAAAESMDVGMALDAAKETQAACAYENGNATHRDNAEMDLYNMYVY